MLLSKANLSVSEIIDLLDTVSQFRKVDETICANDYYHAIAQHDAYCKALKIEHTPWAINRRAKIVNAGLSSVYKGLPSSVRVLSSQDTPEPSIPIHDLTSHDITTGATAETTPSTVERGRYPDKNEEVSECPRADTRRTDELSEYDSGV